MAARTLYPTQDAGPTNWSVAAWSVADDNAKDEAKPINGDTVIFTTNSGETTLDENSADLVAFTLGGGTLDMGTNNLTITTGDCTLDDTLTASAGAVITCGGSIVLAAGMTLPVEIAWVMNAATGTESIYTDGVTIGPLTINDGGGDAEFQLSDALTCAAFVLTDGAFKTNNYDWTPDSINGTGGELDFSTSTVVASGDIILDDIIASVGVANITAAHLDIGTNGSLTATGDFTTDADVAIDGGIMDLASQTWTQTAGDIMTHVSGVLTCTGDYSATISAAGNTISNITGANWIYVVNGTDGSGNTKLSFTAGAPPVGSMGLLEVGR